MGGDQGPRLVVQSVRAFLNHSPNVTAILVGDKAELQQAFDELGPSSIDSKISVYPTNSTISMQSKAGEALRSGSDSSLWKALELVAEGKADACVSGGNTGALMAISRKLLKTFPGVSRPAICKSVPTASGSSLMLDLGANLDCSADQLVQFAVMGSALAQVSGCTKPRVALLNVGEEAGKGSEVIQAAAKMLASRDDIHFVGFVEGHDLYKGLVDVIVCDGLLGNVALKVSEGVATFVFSSLRESLKSSPWRTLLARIAKPALTPWKAKFNPSLYNGAALLGLRKTVVKSHGGADQLGFERALAVAVEQVRADIANKIGERLQVVTDGSGSQ